MPVYLLVSIQSLCCKNYYTPRYSNSTVNNVVFVKYLHFMCYNVHLRVRNVGANSLNVVSRHFPSCFSIQCYTYGNESQFGGGNTLLRHNMNIPAHTYLYVQGGCYFLRFLLHVVRGPCSFDDLETVDRAACQQRVLLENDRHHNEAQTEAAGERSPSALRRLFAFIITMYEPSDPFQLWTAHQENLCEPLTRPTDGYFASLL